MDLKYGEIGQVFQLIDVRTGKLLSEYKRTATGIKFQDFIKSPKEV